jgi:hypothetical protein
MSIPKAQAKTLLHSTPCGIVDFLSLLIQLKRCGTRVIVLTNRGLQSQSRSSRIPIQFLLRKDSTPEGVSSSLQPLLKPSKTSSKQKRKLRGKKPTLWWLTNPKSRNKSKLKVLSLMPRKLIYRAFWASWLNSMSKSMVRR